MMFSRKIIPLKAIANNIPFGKFITICSNINALATTNGNFKKGDAILKDYDIFPAYIEFVLN